MSDKNIYQKNKYFFASFNNDQGLRLDDKTKGLCRQKYRRSSKFVTWGHTTRVIFRVKICIFERSNEKTHFSKTKIYFHKKTTPQLLGHIGLQNMKVGEKTNLGDLPLFVWCMLTLALNCIWRVMNYESSTEVKDLKQFFCDEDIEFLS